MNDEPRVGARLARTPRSRRGSRSPGWMASAPVAPRSVEDARDVEVRLARRRGPDAHRLVGDAHERRVCVGVGVHRDGRDAHRAQRAHARGARSRRDWRSAPCEAVGCSRASLTSGTRRSRRCPRSAPSARGARARCPSTRARVARIDDAVVPDARRGEERVRSPSRSAARPSAAASRLLLRRSGCPARSAACAADDRRARPRAAPAHHRDAMVRPGEQEARIVGAARTCRSCRRRSSRRS